MTIRQSAHRSGSAANFAADRPLQPIATPPATAARHSGCLRPAAMPSMSRCMTVLPGAQCRSVAEPVPRGLSDHNCHTRRIGSPHWPVGPHSESSAGGTGCR